MGVWSRTGLLEVMVSGAVILPSARPSLFNQIVVNPLLASAVALVLSTPLGAAKHAGPVFDGRRGQLTVATPRREGTFVTDGRLDEAEWSSAALLTGFSQFFPADGVAAKESTEVLVFYSATALHVGIRAYAPAGTVRATLAERDKITSDDHVQFFLGTYDDSRQALVFAVNPLGIQSDGVLTETGAQAGSGFYGGTAKAREAADLDPVREPALSRR